MAAGEDNTTLPKPPLWRRLLPLVIMLVIGAVIYSQGWHQELRLENLAQSRETFAAFVDVHYAAGLLLFFLVVVVFVALTIPGATAATVFGGLIFGSVIGGLATLAGATCGAFFMYSVAKTSVGDSLEKRVGPRLERFRDGFRRHALSYMLTLRLIPFFPFWLVTLSAAFLGVRARTLVIGTALGISPMIFILTTLGEGLDALLREQQAAVEACRAAQAQTAVAASCEMELTVNDLITPEVTIALLGLALLSLAPVVVRRLRQRPATEK